MTLIKIIIRKISKTRGHKIILLKMKFCVRDSSCLTRKPYLLRDSFCVTYCFMTVAMVIVAILNYFHIWEWNVNVTLTESRDSLRVG